MFGHGQNFQKPLFQIGRFPIHGAGLIILLEIIGILVVVFTQGRILPLMQFEPNQFMNGMIWTVVTYPFVSTLDFFVLIGLVFFFQFGTMIETTLGRKRFFTLCGLILVTAPLVTLLASFLGLSGVLSGGHILHFGVFAAFCVMNPNIPSFFNVPIKWFGLGFFCLGLLQYIQSGLWGSAIGYTLGIAMGLWYIQEQGLALVRVIPDLPKTRSQPKRAASKRSRRTSSNKKPEPKIKPKARTPKETEVDRILDKINEQGLHTLTAEERQALQKASRKKV